MKESEAREVVTQANGSGRNANGKLYMPSYRFGVWMKHATTGVVCCDAKLTRQEAECCFKINASKFPGADVVLFSRKQSGFGLLDYTKGDE